MNESKANNMDLTPKSSAPWWSVFSCCRPPSAASAGPDARDGDENFEDVHSTSTSAPSSSLKVVTAGEVIAGAKGPLPDTPATACTDSSADASFESQGDGFIGDISASPDRRRGESEDGDFIGEVAVSTPRYSENNSDSSPGKKAAARVESFDGEMSDPDDADYWYAESGGLDENQSPVRSFAAKKAKESDDGEIPDIDSQTTPSANGRSSPPQDQIEMKFYHFMVLMMLRHMFGSWLPGEYDPLKNIFNTRLMLTQGKNTEKRDFRKMMKLRTLKYEDNKCEVVPQLRREEGSLVNMNNIDE